jgi:hypothetical protein
MARIRTIKPEFPQSESIGRLSRDARLLFIQLWTIVDDAGRTRAASRMLASLLYPYDDDAPSLIEAWLAELEREACIRRYEADGSKYLDVVNWLKHQKIDKPTASKLPDYREPSPKPREPSRALATDLGPGPRTRDQEEDHSEPIGSAALGASGPPNEEIEIEVLDESPKARLYREGKTILVSFGLAEKRTGALIGQWLKTKPDPAGLLAAIQFARDQNVAEPVAYISALINEDRKTQHGTHRYQGSGSGGGFAEIQLELARRAAK